MVTERCLDGWFKGKNWKDVSGVFPGNYVTPLRTRDQLQLMHSWKLIPPANILQANYQNPAPASGNATTAGVTPATNTATSQQQLSPSYPSSMRNDLENINARLTLANLTPHQAMPPDLPPRYLTISPTALTVGSNANILTKENRDKEALKEKPTTTGCISNLSSSSSSTGATSSASNGLKKFLTHIKSRSKSPSAAAAAAAAAAGSSTAANAQTNIPSQTLNLAIHHHPSQHLQKQSNNTQNLHTTQTATVTSSSLTPVHVR